MLVAGATKLKSSEIWAMIKAKSSICFQMEHRQCAAYRNSMKTKAIEKSWKKKNIRPQRIWMKWMDCSNEKWQRATLNDYARYDGHKHLFRSFCASSYLLFWMVAETKRTNIECVYQLWQSNRKTETAHSGKNVSTFLPQFFACIFRIFSLFASLCKQNSMLYKFQWKWLLFFLLLLCRSIVCLNIWMNRIFNVRWMTPETHLNLCVCLCAYEHLFISEAKRGFDRIALNISLCM